MNNNYERQVDDERAIDYDVFTMEHYTFNVRVIGERQNREPLVCLADLGVSCTMAYERFFESDDTKFLKNIFCVYLVDLAWLIADAEPMGYEEDVFSFDNFASDFHDLLTKQLQLTRVQGLATGAFGYLMTYTVMQYPKTFVSLILNNPTLKAAGWREFLNIGRDNYRLAYSGMQDKTVNMLMENLVSPKFLSVPEYCVDYIQFIQKIPPINLMKFLQSYIRRKDLTQNLKSLNVAILVFIGEESPNMRDCLETLASYNQTKISNLRIPNSANLVTVENPSYLIVSIKLFLQSMNYLMDEQVRLPSPNAVKVKVV